MSAEVDVTQPDESPPEESVAEQFDEIDRLDPQPSKVMLSNGIEVDVLPMKARQFFKLLKIITHGAGPLIGTIQFGTDSQEFIGQLAGLLIFAVPEAENESLEFVHSLVKLPEYTGPRDNRGVPKTEEGRAVEALRDQINQVLFDPEVEDVLDVIMEVFKREQDDLAALGKRLLSLIPAAKKTGQIPTIPIPT